MDGVGTAVRTLLSPVCREEEEMEPGIPGKKESEIKLIL